MIKYKMCALKFKSTTEINITVVLFHSFNSPGHAMCAVRRRHGNDRDVRPVWLMIAAFIVADEIISAAARAA